MAPIQNFYTANSLYVSTGGNTAGNGTINQPFSTIQAAVTAATAGDHIVVMPGTYTENVVVPTRLYIGAMIPGTATLSNNTAAGSVLTFTGAACDGGFWDGINVVNTNNAAATSVALRIIGVAGMAGQFFFRNCRLSGGTGVGTAFRFDGFAANPLTVDVESVRVIGGNILEILNATDLVTFRNTIFVNGPQDWFVLTGNAAGTCQLIGCDLLGTGGTERFNYGGAAATTALATLRDCRINGAMHLNTTSAAGMVFVNGGTWLRNVTYGSANQHMHKHIGGDEWELGLYNVSLNAIAETIIYTNPAGRTFMPSQVFTENRGAASGALLIYRYNGTGAASIVAAVGAAALPIGVQPEVVLNDEVAAAGTVTLDVTAASGAADFANCHVRGYVS